MNSPSEPQSPFLLRRAEPNDASTILRFIQELAEYEREPDAVVATAEILTAQLQSERPPFECWLAEREGSPVGFALFFLTYSTWLGSPGLWLEDLYVTPAERGHGAGALLLDHLVNLAKERGYGRVELTALNWNTSATDFYKAKGFVAQDDWTTWRLPLG